MRGLTCEGVESGSFLKRKARRADDDISSSTTTSVFDRRFTTKTCEGANMANHHLCYFGARYRYTLVLLDFYVLHGV